MIMLLCCSALWGSCSGWASCFSGLVGPLVWVPSWWVQHACLDWYLVQVGIGHRSYLTAHSNIRSKIFILFFIIYLY